jgi:hypothetical protein
MIGSGTVLDIAALVGAFTGALVAVAILLLVWRRGFGSASVRVSTRGVELDVAGIQKTIKDAIGESPDGETLHALVEQLRSDFETFTGQNAREHEITAKAVNAGAAALDGVRSELAVLTGRVSQLEEAFTAPQENRRTA